MTDLSLTHHINISEMRDAMSIVVKLLANKGVKVTQAGLKAYVQYDTKTLEPVRVNIPMISAKSSPELVVAIKGFIDHEVGHLLFSDAKMIKRAHDERIANMHNIVEDTFIERKMKDAFAGATRNIDATLEFAVKHFFQRRYESTIDQFREANGAISQARYFVHALACPAIRALAGHQSAIDFMEDKWALIPIVYENLEPLTDQLRSVDSSFQALKIANTIRDILANCETEEEEQRRKEQEEAESESDGDDDDSGSGSPMSSGKSRSKSSPSKGDGGGSPGDRIFDDEESSGGGDPSPKSTEPEGDESDDESEGDGSGAGDEKDESGDGEDSDGSGGDEETDDDEETEDAKDPAPKSTMSDDGSDANADDDDDSDDADEEGEDTDSDSDEGEEDEDADSDDEADESDPDWGDEEGDESEDDDEAEPYDNGMTGTDKDLEKGPGSAGGMTGRSDGEMGEHGSLEEAIEDTTSFDAALEQVISDEAKESLSLQGYTPYSSEKDQIGKHKIPSRLVDNAKRRKGELRAHNQERIGVMAKSLERLMSARNRSMFVPGFKSGRLHASNLYKLKTGDTRVFRRKEEIRTKNTAVLLLIDCSGSMTYRDRIVIASEAAYALVSSLDRINVATQVVGFTTANDYSLHNEATLQLEELAEEDDDFKGGFDRTEPLLMPIFKTFEERMTPDVETSIASIPLMDLRSNADSESVEIAANMLAKRTEERKVLIVLSDGRPSCASVHTSYGAGERRQEMHLKKVIEDTERRGIETLGIGIETDAVTEYYPKSIVLDDVAELPAKVMTEMTRILLN